MYHLKHNKHVPQGRASLFSYLKSKQEHTRIDQAGIGIGTRAGRDQDAERFQYRSLWKISLWEGEPLNGGPCRLY